MIDRERTAGALRRWLLPMMALALMGGILLGRESRTWAWLMAGTCCAVVAVVLCLRFPTRRRLALLALTLSVGGLLGWREWHRSLPEADTYHVSGIVADEIQEGSRGKRKTILRNIIIDGKNWPDGAYWTFYETELPEGLAPGATVEADLRLYHPAAEDNPGGFSFKDYLLQRNCSIGLYGDTNLQVSHDRWSLWGAAASLRHSLTQRLCQVMGEEAGGYAATMLLGVRNLIDTEDRDAFSRLGIAHVLSVSGFHVGVLFAAIAWFLRKLRVPRAVQFPIVAAILAFYCVLTGMGAPVIRAAVLVILNEWGHLRHRQRSSLHLLSAAAIITLMMTPSQLTGAGFQLSYGAMLGLALILPSMRWWIRVKIRGRVRRRIAEGLAATLAVQAGILLPQLYWYQQFPVLSLFLNVLVLAVASVGLVLYWIVLLCMWLPVVGPAIGTAVGAVTRAAADGVVWLGSQDWVSLWTCQANIWTAVGCLLIFTGACWLWRMKARFRIPMIAAGLAAVILSVIPWPYTGTEYIQLSVGNADAAILRDGDTVWVIDAGESATAATYLRQRRLSVDTLVISHLHRDHVMGVESLIQNRIPVRRVILPEGAEQQADLNPDCLALLTALEARGAEIVHAARGDVFALPSGDATAIWPERGKVRSGQDPNDYSLTLSLRLRGVTLLTGGDLTSSYEMYAARPADILKVAHHGSSGSTTAEYLEAVDPSVLLLSNAMTSRYERVCRIAEGRLLYATQEVGAITIRFEEDRYEITGYRPGTIQLTDESEDDHGEE